MIALSPVAADQVPKSIAENPAVLYVIGVLFVLGIIVTWLGAKLPVVGKIIDTWNTRRRRNAKVVKNADVIDLKAQVGHFLARLEDVENDNRGLRAELTYRDELAAEHQAWDRDLRARLIDALPAGASVPPPPPPLYPVRQARP